MAIKLMGNQKGWLFPALVVIMRVLFGLGWLLAGVTKITDKSWFKEPGVFLTDYLNHALEKPNVPFFYKEFIEHVALEFVMTFNYVLPILQIIIGACIILGFITIPSIIICLLMHVNFILSGNMNLMSLVLYTSAFLLIIFRKEVYHLSLDKRTNINSLIKTSNNNIEMRQPIDPGKEKLFSNT
ncbi:hypothetical protein HF078_05465 [Bacillus sp. RO2]|jgi:thiosulfate dehydrogenase [quinone] large subunit|uniref:hypothetical protein n=1 Tax=Bacillus sp. RO2 TaxID=2723913 RepID=UPI00145CCB8C|nr:hypothetical protein [Bacillus sp. RO2]NMH72516.1 hypothetical protein [Bacillus sp. RO2]